MSDELGIISVVATGSDNRVVLWERNAAHPGGECFVSNDGKTRKVAETNAVKAKIAEGLLSKVVNRGGRPPKEAKEDDKT